MTIDSLQALATLVLALSAANERLIEAIKNLLAPWLAKERTRDAGVVDPVKDRRRQFVIQVLSILSALLVAAWVAAPPGRTFGGHLTIGTGTNARQVHVVILALLTSGGSAFWNSILDFTRAAAKLREQKADTARLLNAGRLGILPRVADGAALGGDGTPPTALVSVHL